MSVLSRWPRLAVAGLFAIPLALVSGAHGLSSASLRSAPQLSLAAFPYNGLAHERMAFRTFEANAAAGPEKPVSQEGMPQSARLVRNANMVAKAAREAIRREPLAPQAFAILALAEREPARKAAIVTHASWLSRRDLIVQALVLEQKGAAKDYVGVLGTIDEILRVHPERQGEFFPILVQALEVKAAVPGYARLLARPLPWRDAFLTFAVAQDEALENLAAVRERIVPENTDFDRKLIARLAATGSLSTAERIYHKVDKAGDPAARPAGLAWTSDFPPFDWKLADGPGFRAQIGNRQDQLEIDVAPGNGGVIASRLVRNPGRPFTISVTHAIEPLAQIKDVKLVIACPGQSAAAFERAFAARQNAFVIDQTFPCDYLDLAIAARSWTDARALSGTLSPLRITTKKQ